MRQPQAFRVAALAAVAALLGLAGPAYAVPVAAAPWASPGDAAKVVAPAPAAVDTAGALRLTFEKTSVDEVVWEGTVAGSVEGGLRTELKSLEEDGQIWNVRFLWIIDAGEGSFTADLNGTLNLETGVAEMRGEVIEAADPALVGARVSERGQLVGQDPETGVTTFEGTIQVEP